MAFSIIQRLFIFGANNTFVLLEMQLCRWRRGSCCGRTWKTNGEKLRPYTNVKNVKLNCVVDDVDYRLICIADQISKCWWKKSSILMEKSNGSLNWIENRIENWILNYIRKLYQLLLFCFVPQIRNRITKQFSHTFWAHWTQISIMTTVSFRASNVSASKIVASTISPAIQIEFRNRIEFWRVIRMSAEAGSRLSEQQLALIERNRQKALSLRANRLANHPYNERGQASSDGQPPKP